MFFKNILKLLSGTVLAQLLTILTIPVIANIFKPEIFGQYNLILTIISFIIILGTFTLEKGIILAENKKEVTNLIQLINKITIIVLAMIFILMTILLLFNIKIYNNFNFFILIFIILLAYFNINNNNLYFLNNKYENYRKMGRSRIIIAVTFPLVAMILYIILDDVNIYILLIAQITAYIASTKYLKIVELKYNLNLGINLSEKITFEKYKNFPKYTMPHVLYDSFTNLILLLTITNTYGATNVGIYAMAVRLYKAPASIITAGVSTVYNKKIADLFLENNLNKLKIFFKKVVLILLVISTLSFILLYLLTNLIYDTFFDESWSEAKLVSKLLIIWLFSYVVCTPVMGTFQVLNKQREIFPYIIFYNTTVIILAVISDKLIGEFNDFILYYSILGCIFNIIFLLKLNRVVRKLK